MFKFLMSLYLSFPIYQAAIGLSGRVHELVHGKRLHRYLAHGEHDGNVSLKDGVWRGDH